LFRCLPSPDVPLALSDPLPWSVGSVVVPVSPEELDEPDAPDEWAPLEGAFESAPLEGTFGRYSFPAGPASAVAVSTSEAHAASPSNVAFLRKVI
jgi:hypothetical protein